MFRRLWLYVLCCCALVSFVHAQENPARGDVRLMILGDFNGSYGSLTYPSLLTTAIDAAVNVWQPDVLLSPGDVVAGQSHSLPDTRFLEMWQAFDKHVAAPLRNAGIAYAVANGNHDGSKLRDATKQYVFARERDAASTYWQQSPRPPQLHYLSQEHYPFQYAFMIENVFVLVIDASAANLSTEEQTWISSMLNHPQAQAASLRIVMGHLPLYGVSDRKNHAGEVMQNGDTLATWLASQGAHMYISGHHAAYYPAQTNELTLIHSSGIGAHALVGSDVPASPSVTLIDVNTADRTLTLSTFELGSMQRLFVTALPEVIHGLNGPVYRVPQDTFVY